MGSSKKLYLFGILELINLGILLKNPSSFWEWSGLIITHGIILLILYTLLIQIVLKDKYLRARFKSPFLLSFLPFTLIPVFGPAFLLALILTLKFIRIKYRELTLYEVITPKKLETYTLLFLEEQGEIPEKELMDFLVRRNQEPAFKWLRYIKNQPWTAFRTKFLRFILQYASNPHIILEASRQIEDKRREIFEKIATLEETKNFLQLALSYYQIYELCLGDPYTNYSCLKKACLYLEKEIKKNEKNLRLLRLISEWYLQLLDLKKAEKYILKGLNLAKDSDLKKEFVYLNGVINFLKGK